MVANYLVGTIPVDGCKPGLARAELADDAHQPVLQIYQKQNRELSYASLCVGETGHVKSDLIDQITCKWV
jgi:hypothetical protein